MSGNPRGQRAKAALRAAVLQPIGRALAAPRVQLTSPNTRGGNALYYWLWAHANDSPRRPSRVLIQENFSEWASEFPLIDYLSTTKDEASWVFSEWIDQRRDLFGIHFAREQLDSFCQDLVSSSQSFQFRMEEAREFIGANSAVVNVRRGDYYQYPHLEAMYGLDIGSYVTQASKMLEGSVTDWVVVSDDREWCARNVSALLPGEVRYISGEPNIFRDFAVISSARSLILANSTFSFWGAHVGKALGNLQTCLAPPYHFRNDDGTPNAERYDPEWIVVPEL